LIIALIARARAARVVALVLVFVSTLAVWPVYHYGKAAADRILAMADSDGREWLEEHEHRAEKLIYLFYALATLAALGLAAERFAPRAAVSLTIAALVLAAATLTAGGYIASAGGRIRHREFRYVLPPEETQK
jgi:dolichol kinase